MSLGAAIAPVPISPHARAFETGEIHCTPSFSSFVRCSEVKGLSHMKVFIAGATYNNMQSCETCCSHVYVHASSLQYSQYNS